MGPGLRPLDVPRHRGPDLRRDRGRHQPEGPGAADPPAAASADDRPDQHPHCAWTVIIDESHPAVAPIPALAAVDASPRGRARAATRSTPPTRAHADYSGPLRLRPRLRGVLALGTGADRRRGVPPDAPAEPGLPRSRSAPAPPSPAQATRDRHQAAGRHRRHRRRADPPRARHRRRCGTLAAAPAAQPGGVRRRGGLELDAHRDEQPRPRRTAPGSRCAAPTRSGRSRPSSAPSTRTSTSRSPGPATDWTATVVTPRRARRRSFDEVAVTRFSTGSSFTLRAARSLPITPV